MRVQIVFGVLCACVMAAIDSSTSNSEVTQFHQVKADDGCAVCGMSPPNRTLKNIQHRVHCVSSCNHGCPSRCQAVNYWKTAKLCQLFYYEPCSYDTQDDCVIYRVTNTELLIHLWFFNQSSNLSDTAQTKQLEMKTWLSPCTINNKFIISRYNGSAPFTGSTRFRSGN